MNDKGTDRGRQVEVRQRREAEFELATFKVWGYQRVRNADTGTYAMQTMAIVELQDGRVKQIYPDNLRFIDRGDINA